ncbi:MAG: hypothetical protein WKG07_17195 [Hymenobacter sp.]
MLRSRGSLTPPAPPTPVEVLRLATALHFERRANAGQAGRAGAAGQCACQPGHRRCASGACCTPGAPG